MQKGKIERFFATAQDEGMPKAIHLAGKYFISTLPRRGVPYYYRTRAWYNWNTSGAYSYQPDPFKIIRVDPAEIKYRSENRFSYMGRKYYDAGIVRSGNWDLPKRKFTEMYTGPDGRLKNPVYKSFEARFCDNIPWEETPLVKNVMYHIRAGESKWHGCESEKDVQKRCRKMDKMYESMKREGYKSRRELIAESDKSPTNPQWFWQVYDEVVVNVGRSGELLFVGGHHRLSMAKLLGIDKIPVRIFVRHSGWQEQIDRCYKSGEINCDHPDLHELQE